MIERDVDFGDTQDSILHVRDGGKVHASWPFGGGSVICFEVNHMDLENVIFHVFPDMATYIEQAVQAYPWLWQALLAKVEGKRGNG